ncbi:MAG TPA: hypothetical protein VGF48_10725 [Thermoanaerobaculia bacterium]|jgi:hypothetical protein
MTQIAEEKFSAGPNPGPNAAENRQDPHNPPPPPPAPSEVNNGDVRNQYNAGTINNHNYFRDKNRRTVHELLQALPNLASPLYPYRHPLHADIVEKLEKHGIAVLTSDGDAAFVAGHALANDPCFSGWKKSGLFIATLQDKDRKDLDLVSVTEALVKDERQVLVVEVGDQRTFLDAILHVRSGALTNIRVLLEKHRSHLVLVVDDALLEDADDAERITAYHRWQVSQLEYLLSRDFPTQAGELEKRLRRIFGPRPATFAERRALYRLVESHLAHGPEAFLRFIAEREAAANSGADAIPAEVRTITAVDVFKEDSEVHKSTAFIAASFPEVNQKDFDRFVRLTLGDAMIRKEEVRQAFRRDGKLVTVRDSKEERCSDVWGREADAIFRDCGLRTIAAGNGAWVVDFSEPHLRAALRSHLGERHPWYLRQQCERLQQSGIFFDAELSPAGVDGLVRLFVERAIADPAAFGRPWLGDLVRGTTVRSGKETPGRQRVIERLSILIREMADRNVLRPVIRQFFEQLLASREHDTLLDLIAEPALQYLPDFDPLIWMRRLLNEGTDEIQTRTQRRLLYLARRAGPRIYEFLATIYDWLPDEDCEAERYSTSELLALNFPFLYCDEMAPWVEAGAWPSDHPLFYALPPDPAEASGNIGALVAWLIDTRGATDARAEPSDPLKTSQTARFDHVAELLEHFAWVLEGNPATTPAPDGQALLTLLLQELDTRLSPRERTWLQRSWQRTQEELLRDAGTRTGTERTLLVARKTKLDQLRVRFATAAAAAQKIRIQGEPKP